jgi:acyl dehydratase
MAELVAHSVVAFNAARQSENKMHDDTVAKQFGFSGGLVPGVDVFAYMSHQPLVKWGRAFLERGVMQGRFLKPVYDGETATVTASERDGGLDLTIESRGEICGTGHATLPATAGRVSLDDYKSATPPPDRPHVSDAPYEVGSWLGIRPHKVSSAVAEQYLQAIGETDPVYRTEKIIPCGTLLRCANWALTHNAVLGPWIHVGSTLHAIAPAHVDDELTVRARVTKNYDHKGHKFVELDALIVANGKTPVARIDHVAIYAPRRVAAA